MNWPLHRETNERVAGISVDLRSRFRWRAERRARKLNTLRIVPFFRWEVQRESGRYAVVAMQNVAEVEQ